MIDTLASLFGSVARLRLLRLFLWNQDTPFSVAEIADKTMVSSAEVQRELRVLERIEFVKSRKTKGRRIYRAVPDFPLRDGLLGLVGTATVTPECKTLTQIGRIGDVHLALVSGIFINFTKARADLFVVANDVSRAQLTKVMKSLEAEVGREVSYVLLSLEEFRYRINMTDRFLQDFLQGPYEEVVNNIPQFKRLVSATRRR